ncbi:MAG TPA: OmpH family outer membrane protein [Magnetospirillum sp.]|nr:OmpH family outer membrane protein [Magnetospirillum sp.]
MSAWLRAHLWRAVVAAQLAFCAPAMAEPAVTKLPVPTIMVVDVQAALQQSLAAKSLRTQRDQYLQGFQGELEKNRAALKETENDLVKQKSSMPPEQWQQKARAFEQQVYEFNQRFQRSNQAVDKSFRAGMSELSDALAQVTEELAGELGANLVLPKSQIFLHDPRMEVTQQVIERLNRKFPSVTFPTPNAEGDGASHSPPPPKKK